MTDSNSNRTEFIKAFNLLVDEPLKKYTSFGIGGPADLLAHPRTREELRLLIAQARDLKIPVHLYGGGSNLLISDKGIRGLVIFTSRMRSDLKMVSETDRDVRIESLAGNRLSNICQYAKENNLTGIEFAIGIPGTLGGALMMNAGTPDGQILDVIESIEILDAGSLEFKTLPKSALDFEYRALKLKDVIVSARIRLEKNMSPTHVSVRFNQLLKKKNATQPVSARSAGCFFKNPEKGEPAGKLIQDAGLKGKRVNDAVVSEIHANYIINAGQATCRDVLELKTLIQDTIFEKYGINLETEVRVEGEK